MLKLDNSIIKDHEEEFIENVNKSGFIISIGCKGGGKSFLMMAYLKHALYNKTFQHIHFVCPCYSGEQNNSYDFLKNQKHVMIYKHYTEEVSKRVDKDRKKGKT